MEAPVMMTIFVCHLISPSAELPLGFNMAQARFLD
jgi:hypothetical protein